MTHIQTQNTPSADDRMQSPRVPDMREIFDLFMERVDPRFTHAGQAQLKNDLAAASADARVAIVEKYESALVVFSRWAKQYFRDLHQALGAFRAEVEAETRRGDLATTEDALNAIPR